MKLKLLLTATFITLGLIIVAPVYAQFSGSDPENYNCPVFNTLELVGGPNLAPSGRIICLYNRLDTSGNIVERNVLKDAILRPPTLQIVEVWFVRIIYLLWALAGVAFTASLIWIGFKYMTSFNNQYDLGKTIGDFRKWLIGLAIIFLSYPILVTFFRILPLSNSQCYDDISMPGFQFFFPTVCQSRESYCSVFPLGTSTYQQCLDGLIDPGPQNTTN